ncbi:MAG: sialate O-acetylesterase [Gemmataceae bacterium]
MRKLAIVLAFVWGMMITPQANAAVKVHSLFSNGMVLQRNTKVPVWGTADKGEKVMVTITRKVTEKKDGKVMTETMTQSRDTKTDANGRWMVYLKDLPTGGPYTMTVKGSTNEITFSDVLAGEVWICSGQSNMEWSLNRTRDWQKAAKKAKNPMIRMFRVPKFRSAKPLDEFGTDPRAPKNLPAKWVTPTPENVPNFTAVGHYFGRDLQKALDVPVGLIQCAWGGTAAEEWTSQEVLTKNKFPERGRQTTLYNGMLKPIQPYAIRGVIWYQGESNARTSDSAKLYKNIFSAMIKNWRDDWGGQALPFLFVQLAPWNRPKTPSWAYLRESQLKTWQTLKNTGMAVITDYGHPTNIHPLDKEPVGSRLALAARGIAYKEAIVYSGPVYETMKTEGNKIRLFFRHVGSGLKVKGQKLKGFTIAGDDMNFVPAEAKIDGRTVVVSSEKISNPVAVRFGWANYPEVNFYNAEGLPATPFRTDTDTENTKKK